MTSATMTTMVEAPAAMKVVRFRNAARAFACCYQIFKNDQRFAKHPELAKRLARQIKAGRYMFVVADNSIVGFTSWLKTTPEDGEAWANGNQLFAAELEGISQDGTIVVEQWCSAGIAVDKVLSQKLLSVVGTARKIYARTEIRKGTMIPVKLEKKDLAA